MAAFTTRALDRFTMTAGNVALLVSLPLAVAMFIGQSL
jgi:hypothetical protein